MVCPECGTWNRGSAAHCARRRRALPERPDAPPQPPDEELGLLRRATGGRHRIERRLGTGGMANVYLARHAALGCQVVFKVLLPHLAREAEMRERFRREAEAASQLAHPHICPILDYGELTGSVFLVMPYCAGGSLA